MWKSWDRFVIFCRKMINARHSFGICQTPKISNFARLKWTLPPSTEIIHSHIWGPPLTRATYLKHTSMLDNKGRRSDGTFKVANRILVWPMWDSLQIQSPSYMGHRQKCIYVVWPFSSGSKTFQRWNFYNLDVKNIFDDFLSDLLLGSKTRRVKWMTREGTRSVHCTTVGSSKVL